MSFGYSAGDVILISQLVLHTLEATRNASNEYGELTRQVSSLAMLLKRVENEVSSAQPPISPRKATDPLSEQFLSGSLDGVFDKWEMIRNQPVQTTVRRHCSILRL
jgi:hypothetical protein